MVRGALPPDMSVSSDVPQPAGAVAPWRPVTWLVAGVLLAAAMVIAVSVYAGREVRRLRDEQVALTERHGWTRCS